MSLSIPPAACHGNVFVLSPKLMPLPLQSKVSLCPGRDVVFCLPLKHRSGGHTHTHTYLHVMLDLWLDALRPWKWDGGA